MKYHISWKAVYRLRAKRAKRLRKAWKKSCSDILYEEYRRNKRLAKEAYVKWMLGNKYPKTFKHNTETCMCSGIVSSDISSDISSETSFVTSVEGYRREEYGKYCLGTSSPMSYDEYWHRTSVMQGHC